MIVNDGVCRKATIQLMLVEVLDVFGMLFHILQCIVERFKIWDDLVNDCSFIAGIGCISTRDFIIFNQSVMKSVKSTGELSGGRSTFDGADLQPIIVNGIL